MYTVTFCSKKWFVNVNLIFLQLWDETVEISEDGTAWQLRQLVSSATIISISSKKSFK